MPIFFAILSWFFSPLSSASPAAAQETAAPSGLNAPASAATATVPAFIALSPNINDFSQFADGGPDSNWYIGFNNAWIVQLPAAPASGFARAFIGAKIGRAKTRPKPGRPWEHEVIPGKVYIGVSPTPSFSSAQTFFLAETSDIPLEPDPKDFIRGVGQSTWFWAEVPLSALNTSGPNYLIVWSPTENFTDDTTSPILAALESRGAAQDEAISAWVNRSIQGVPPREEHGTLETPIRRLQPALAIKLVPKNDNTVTVSNCAASPNKPGLLFSFNVTGQDPDIAWVERSSDQLEWERVSKFQRRPPYFITLAPDVVGHGAYFRAVARDTLGNEGSCSGQFVSNAGTP